MNTETVENCDCGLCEVYICRCGCGEVWNGNDEHEGEQ
jgi:hypothetical protein